jgi:serine O-acetyltransferase
MQLIMRLHMASRRLLAWKLRPLAKLAEGTIRILCAARLPVEAKIDPSVQFSHNGLAVLITKESVIGPGCQIGTHVVLGSNWPKLGAPTLEADVIVGPGAIILGPVTLGKGSIVAAGSIVLDDVAPATLVAGSPATMRKENVDVEEYRYPVK